MTVLAIDLFRRHKDYIPAISPPLIGNRSNAPVILTIEHLGAPLPEVATELPSLEAQSGMTPVESAMTEVSC